MTASTTSGRASRSRRRDVAFGRQHERRARRQPGQVPCHERLRAQDGGAARKGAEEGGAAGSRSGRSTSTRAPETAPADGGTPRTVRRPSPRSLSPSTNRPGSRRPRCPDNRPGPGADASDAPRRRPPVPARATTAAPGRGRRGRCAGPPRGRSRQARPEWGLPTRRILSSDTSARLAAPPGPRARVRSRTNRCGPVRAEHGRTRCTAPSPRRRHQGRGCSRPLPATPCSRRTGRTRRR